MKKLFLRCFLIVNNFLGLFSIHFDNSPYENLYFKTGSENHLLEECCREGCWDTRTSAICQAPDFREVFHLVVDCNDARPDNHIPGLLLQSAKTLKENESVQCLRNTVTRNHDKVVSCQSSKNILEETFSNGLKMQNANILLLGNELNISTKGIFHVGNKFISPRDEEMQEDIVHPNRREFPQELRLRLQNHYKFLLLNSTIAEPSLKTNLSQIYETLKSSDVSRVLVKLLQEKLKWLEEKEELSLQNAFGDMVSKGTKPPQIPKVSKWDVVRQAFLTNHRFDISTPDHQATTTTFKPDDSDLVYNEGKHNVAHKISKTIGSIDSSQEFKKIMDQFYAVNRLDFTPSRENAKIQNDYDKAADYDTVEYFDVNLPYNFEQVGADMNHLEKLSSSTTEKFTKASLKSDTLIEEEKFELEGSSTSKLNSNITFSEPPTSKSNDNAIQSKSWKRVLWPIDNNMNKFKKMFVRDKKIINNSSRERKPIKLDEHFILNLNSKNIPKEELLESSRVDKTTKPPYTYDYPSFSSSSESASSESEDLHNNSIVFVVRDRNTTGLNKDSRWRSILNFFHIAKAVPCPQGKNPCIDSSNKSCSFNKPKSRKPVTRVPETTTPKIIHLPESLMPEALEGRQLNATGFIFYDSSSEEENKNLDNSNVTSNTFLFFFK